MAHATMLKFGYPASLIREYEYWAVQIRPEQVTLGALVLICKADVAAFSQVGDAGFAELPKAVRHIESTLAGLFSYDKLNYLMLMMVDPQVHFHVIPRYRAARQFGGVTFDDPGWPGPPDLGHATRLGAAADAALIDRLRQAWPVGGPG